MAGKKLTDASIATRSAPIPASALMRWVTDPSGTPTDEKSSLTTLLATIGQSTMGPLTLSATSADLAMTWNSGGTTYTGLKLNVTDTASNAASLLADLQVGGASKLKVSKTGAVTFGVSGFNPVYFANTSSPSGVPSMFGRIGFPGNNGVNLSAPLYFATTITNQGDLVLDRDAANTLGQRNGANAQTFNLYNTYTNASNYELGGFRWNSNILEIRTAAAGTGTVRALSLTPAEISMPNLPTSDPAVSGRLWNDGGTLKVSA